MASSRAPDGAVMKADVARAGSVTTARARRWVGEDAEGVAGEYVTLGQ
ncbi:hypothetical protein QOZ96_001160 [Brevundimonas nasdae]|nr:hypothetical protein [Brevundimonas nasdae]MDQ0451217.1 hypothetical protein [Brevundimonas nasdae]